MLRNFVTAVYYIIMYACCRSETNLTLVFRPRGDCCISHVGQRRVFAKCVIRLLVNVLRLIQKRVFFTTGKCLTDYLARCPVCKAANEAQCDAEATYKFCNSPMVTFTYHVCYFINRM